MRDLFLKRKVFVVQLVLPHCAVVEPLTWPLGGVAFQGLHLNTPDPHPWLQ